MMMRRNQIRKKFPNTSNNTRTEAHKSQVSCFGCNKTGHYKSGCPDIKKVQRKPSFKKKAVISHSSILEYYQSNVSEEKYSWKASTTENVYHVISVKHGLNYQCQDKHV
jgi:hypothetical protein